MFETLRKVVARLKAEIKVYQRVLKDKRTPKVSKVLLGLALGYLLTPIDLIPDGIPVLGQLDDLIIVPALVYAALCFVPAEVLKDARNSGSNEAV